MFAYLRADHRVTLMSAEEWFEDEGDELGSPIDTDEQVLVIQLPFEDDIALQGTPADLRRFAMNIMEVTQ